MMNEQAFTAQPTIRLFQHKLSAEDNLMAPFAYTDLLIRQTDTLEQPMLHFWEAEDLVILGMQDTRVKALGAGLKSIQDAGYSVVVRNSGGLGVVADQGILNFSLFLPFSESKPISITKGYELMAQVIQRAFQEFQVEITAGEVSDSYCPGEFDLSIAGQKFAGIAQRRIRNGLVVMIYMSVNGAQAKRGELMRRFYQVSLGDDFGKNKFPPVRPGAMANLSQLVGVELTVAQVQALVSAVFERDLHKTIIPTDFASYVEAHDLDEALAHHLGRMVRRNETINEIGVERDASSL